MGRRIKIEFFVSYARSNSANSNKFLERFKEQVAASLRYEYKFWQDGNILIGEDWDEEIRTALKRCNLGLLLINPAFLASEYILKKELPIFLKTDKKPIIPVMLQQVDFERHNLKGLKKRQIFQLEGERFKFPKTFLDCTGNQRDRFVHSLFLKVEKKLDNIHNLKEQKDLYVKEDQFTTINSERDLKYKVRDAVKNADLHYYDINNYFPKGKYISEIKNKNDNIFYIYIEYWNDKRGKNFPSEQVEKFFKIVSASKFPVIIATNALRLTIKAQKILEEFNLKYKKNKLYIITGQTRDAFIEKIKNI